MATSTQAWIEELKSISVLELAERIKALEEEFGVSATAVAAPVAAPAGGGGEAGGESAEEAGALDVILTEAGDKKIQVNPRLNSGRVWSSSPHFSAIHSRDGFWGLAGPRIKRGLALDASILDLAPTLTRLLNVRTVEDFDGHVLDSVFSPVGPS